MMTNRQQAEIADNILSLHLTEYLAHVRSRRGSRIGNIADRPGIGDYMANELIRLIYVADRCSVLSS